MALPSFDDVRTFGDQAARVVSDVNRPNDVDTTTAKTYLQDAVRYWRNRPWFYNQRDNTTVPSWTGSTAVYVGWTIQAVATDLSTYAYVCTTAGTTGGGAPSFPTSGTVSDNGVVWTFGGSLTNTSSPWTSLSTVSGVNQYVPPVDFVRQSLLQVTVAGVRYEMTEQSYAALQSYDVIRPAPDMAYPWWYAFFNQRFYLYPYPNGFYPLTLSYQGADAVPTQDSDVSSWTTDAERLIRRYAEGTLYAELLHDEMRAAESFLMAEEEAQALCQKTTSQVLTGGIPSSEPPWMGG